jgi:hypothetical protein
MVVWSMDSKIMELKLEWNHSRLPFGVNTIRDSERTRGI